MAGMFLAGVQGMSAFAVGTIIVVAVAMLGRLTVLRPFFPLGDNVERGASLLVGRLRRYGGGNGVWCAIVTRVLRRPVLSLVLAGGVLLALALPALQPALCSPASTPIRSPSTRFRCGQPIDAAFPGSEIPAEVVVKAPDIAAPDSPGGDRRAPATGARDRADARAGHRGRQPGRNGGRNRAPGRRRWNERGLSPPCRRSART